MRDIHTNVERLGSADNGRTILDRKKTNTSNNNLNRSKKYGTVAIKRSVTKSKIRDRGWYSRIIEVVTLLFNTLRRTLNTLLRFLKPLLNKGSTIIKSLPWKIIAPTSVFIVITGFLVFNFYLASPERITQSIEANYESSQILEDEINKSTVFIQQIPPYSTDIAEAETSLYKLKDLAAKSSVSLPPKIFSDYAFRNDDELLAQIDTLYISSENINLPELESYAQSTIEILNLSKQLFEQDISENTQDYIDSLKESKQKLEAISNQGSTIDTSTQNRIIQQVLDSAEQYQLTKNIDNFNQQTGNVTSELYKVTYQSWIEYAQSTQANLSTFRSSSESIIFAR